MAEKMKGFGSTLRQGVAEVDAELRRLPPYLLIVVSCLALILACFIAFGELHL